MIELERAELALFPMAFTATTKNLLATPLLVVATVTECVAAFVVAIDFRGLLLLNTRYDVMAEFPVSVGAVHVRLTELAAFEVATTLVGATGTLRIVIGEVGADKLPSPPLLLADILK
jgi:hypothetical protein